MRAYCRACHWEQDEFWTWDYNPIRELFGEVIPSLWTDERKRRGKPPYGGQRIFWRLFWNRFIELARKVWNQEFWTYRDYERAAANPWWPTACPECKCFSLEIEALDERGI